MDHITPVVLKEKNIRRASVKNKRVLVRVDYNVPLKNGAVKENTRIKNSLQTISYLLKKGAAQIILISHLGRPKGVDAKYSLDPVKYELEKLLKRKVVKLNSCNYSEYELLSQREKNAKIVLLENVRFYAEEKENKRSFAKKLAEFADLYVNDAFGTAHRKHASNNAITKLLPSYIGCLVEKEVKTLTQLRSNPKRPFVSLIGFSKIVDKLEILEQLLKNSDTVLIGGAVAFTFGQALGYKTGKSLIEPEMIPTAQKLLKKYRKKIILPLDIVGATSTSAKIQKVYPFNAIPDTIAGYDIGPETIELFSSVASCAKTVFWNGPMGLFEVEPYDFATLKIGSRLKNHVVIGGGDTVSSLKNVSESFFFSTGGGASIAALRDKPLPAIQVLYQKSIKKYEKRQNGQKVY